MTRRFLLFALLSLPALAEDCATCTPARLCEAHVASDKEATKLLHEGLRQKDAGARQKAVEAFAEACGRHANCRPAGNATTLALALKDPHPSVRSLAAELLGKSQDPKSAGLLLTKEAEAAMKRMARAPKTDKEKIAWNEEITVLRGIVEGMVRCGAPEAGPGMARLLASDHLDVLQLVKDDCKDVRHRDVPPAIVAAMEKCRTMPFSNQRDVVTLGLVNAWEVITKSGIKSPISEANDPKEMDRFIRETGEWWAKNGKTWK